MNIPMRQFAVVWVSGMFAMPAATAAQANQPTPEEIAHIPGVELPPSAYLSPEAEKSLGIPAIEPPTTYSRQNIVEIRRVLDGFGVPVVEEMRQVFPANVTRIRMAGVPVSVVTPKDGVAPENRGRVLIELHAGAFIMGAGYGVAESAAIAAVGKVKVYSVDYRLTPENAFPAASEDVATVFRELLKEYPPRNIGIFGSSAGGLLVSEVVVWLQHHHLPRPGAVAMLGSGADARFDGDSRYTSPASGYGVKPSEQVVDFMLESYFGDADLKDALISPVWSQEALSQFPPTLIVTSTRAHEMSSAIFTHHELVRAGVAADLRIWDGLPHCFYLLAPTVPESREVFDTVAKFFAGHLAR